MADHYIIAAGGTGAMCAQAFIHLAAAGCVNREDKYNILLVDKDKDSDAITACRDLLTNYGTLRDQLVKNPNGKYIFPEIRLDTWDFTSEILDEYQKKTKTAAGSLGTLTLEKLLNPNNDPQMSRMLSTMYTKEERNVDLNQGFYGHPNIGALVFDYVKERFLEPDVMDAGGQKITHQFMTDLRNSLNTGRAHVYLFGSLFGGTGATIIPNVVLALQELPGAAAGLILGGSVIMPYFKLPDCRNDSEEMLKNVRPADQKFARQTIDALEYYHESGLLNHMMNLLLVGTSTLDVTSEMYARGGEQHQHSHVVLLVAAAAAARFFADKLGNMTDGLTGTTVVPQKELLVWKINSENPAVNNALMPAELDLNVEHTQLMEFLRFCVVVKFYMGWRFSPDQKRLKSLNEVRGTAKMMGLDPQNLSDDDIIDHYKAPVKAASFICKQFIEFLYDVALSGYDWSGYRDLVRSAAPTKWENGKAYYTYQLGNVKDDAVSAFNMRWVDFADPAKLKQLVDADAFSAVVFSMSLNSISSYKTLDAGNPNHVEKKFPSSVAKIYIKVLKKLGLVTKLFGKDVKNDQRYFGEIYDTLRANCV